MLRPGETRRVDFRLPAESLAFVGIDLRWHLEAGDFLLRCGTLTLPIRCTETSVFDR